MSYCLEIPESQVEKLQSLDADIKERIMKKLDEIEYRLSSLGLEPEQAIEKRLKGRLHPLLQQRIGDYRIWFKENKDSETIYLYAIKHKEDAKDSY